jgi:hypothetical protein
MRAPLLLVASILLFACRGGDAGEPAGSAKPAVTTAPTVAPRPTVTASAAPPAPTAASSAPSSSASASPDGASAPPTREEWDAAPEVNVTGSSALACDTKRVREWVGVFCGRTNDSGGTPMKAKLDKAETLHPGAPAEQRKDVKITSFVGETALVARFVAGTDVEATFSWTDKQKRLVLWWPADKPEPKLLGAFK